MQKKSLTETILLILIILTIAGIWIQSMMSKEISSSESGFVMDLIRPVLELVVGKGNVTMHLVRKLAHFTEYFLLGLELTAYMNIRPDVSLPYPVSAWILPLGISLTVASLDEIIQIFSQRGPMIQDVLLDFSGALTACIVINVIFRIANCSRFKSDHNT